MIRASLPLEEAARWDFLVGSAICAIWLLWAFIVYADVRAWVIARDSKGVTNCPLCRGMHKPGECKRDQGGEQDEP